jgi:hypothetical protein
MIDRFRGYLRRELEFMTKPKIPHSNMWPVLPRQRHRHRRLTSLSNISALSGNSDIKPVGLSKSAAEWAFTSSLPDITSAPKSVVSIL